MSISEILKIQNSMFSYEFSQVYYISLKKLPIIYTRLFDTNRISLEEYKLIKWLWESENFCLELELLDLLEWFFDSNSISKSNRNSFNSSLSKLVKYGILSYNKIGFREIRLSLSGEIFGKIQSYYGRYLINVDLFYSVYMKEVSHEQFFKYLDLCKEVGVEPLKRSRIIEINRIPLIGLRSPIVGLREPIIGLRKPIISDKSRDYFPNQRRKIDFNAKKYEGLTENEKKQLESLAKFGQEYVDRKLKQMKKNQFSIAEKLEMDCIDKFVPYYENLVCKATGRISYTVLPNQRKKLSRHWTSIFKCYTMCIDKGYNWKIYLEAQFESFKHWNTSNLKYPLPNLLCTERAINAYENYLYHNETAYQNEGWETKVSSKEVGNYYEELRKVIEIDLGIINNVISYSLKKSFNKTFKNVDKSRSDLDNLYHSKAVQQSWEDLSPEFWTTVPQMREFLKKLYGEYASLDAKIDLYEELMSNNKKVQMIKEICSTLRIPKLYGIIEVDEKMK